MINVHYSLTPRYDEIKDYSYSTHQSVTGKPVGHFTQVLGSSFATRESYSRLRLHYYKNKEIFNCT